METHEVYELAQEIHQNQRTKKGKRYFGHIWKVHEIAKEIFLKEHNDTGKRYVDGDFERIRQIALLHDSVEDQITEAQLRSYSLDPEVIEAVMVLTKREGQEYTEYMQLVEQNKLANLVKRADLEHNSKLSRLSLDDGAMKIKARHAKYVAAYLYLLGIE